MPKQSTRQPGIHLHKTNVTRKNGYQVTVTKEYYWILIAKNGKTIAKSSETYKRKRDAVNSIKLMEAHFSRFNNYYDHTGKEIDLVFY